MNSPLDATTSGDAPAGGGGALTGGAAWQALTTHHAKIGATHLRELFASDATRGKRLVLEAAGLCFDYSKNRIADETLQLLPDLAAEHGVRMRTASMFRGDVINTTEKRSVPHVALRASAGQSLRVGGVDVVAEVQAVLERIGAFADAVRTGRWLGHTGKCIRNVVNIGIGGSDLGPVMAYETLRFYSRRDLTMRFVSNVDSTGSGRGAPGSGCRRNALHRLVEDVHDPRNLD